MSDDLEKGISALNDKHSMTSTSQDEEDDVVSPSVDQSAIGLGVTLSEIDKSINNFERKATRLKTNRKVIKKIAKQ